jgi:hypothetical protein
MIEVSAYAPTAKMLKKYPRMRASWIVPCEQCGCVHYHSPCEGPRTPHCYVHGVDNAKPYTLRFAGEAPAEVVERLTKRRRKTRC